MVILVKMSSIAAMPCTFGNDNIPRIFGTSVADGQVYEWDYAGKWLEAIYQQSKRK
jgi:hypothetical protein